MKTYQGDERDYDSSFGDGVLQSIKTSLFLSLICVISIEIFQKHSSLFGLIGNTVMSVLFLCLMAGFITLVATSLLAYPTLIILRYFNLASEVNVALVAGLITFVFVMWISHGEFTSFYYIIVFWGMACGYTFMKGYKNG